MLTLLAALIARLFDPILWSIAAVIMYLSRPLSIRSKVTVAAVFIILYAATLEIFLHMIQYARTTTTFSIMLSLLANTIVVGLMAFRFRNRKH